MSRHDESQRRRKRSAIKAVRCDGAIVDIGADARRAKMVEKGISVGSLGANAIQVVAVAYAAGACERVNTAQVSQGAIVYFR